MSERKTVLVVGGLGFVGRALVRALQREKHRIHITTSQQVTAIDDESVKPFERFDAWEEKERPIYEKVDVRKPKDIRQVLRRVKPAVIYWLAARQGYDRDWANYAKVNVAASYTFWESFQWNGCHLPEKVVLASSQAVYAPAEAVRETYPAVPPSVYGLTKLQQEQAFFHFANQFGVPLVALRYSIILGGGQSMQSTESGILRNWWRDYKADRPPQVYGAGTHLRDFVSIGDVTRANLAALRYPVSEIFNIGGPEVTIKEMARIFSEEAGAMAPEVTGKDHRPGGEYSLYSDSSKARELLKWQARDSVRDMIRGFIASLREIE